MNIGHVAGLFLAATTLSATAASAQPAASWNGAYVYEQPQGRDAGGAGPAAFVDHRLTVGSQGCRLTAKGYQTDTTIRCAAKPAGDRLDVTFVSFGDGKLVNQYGTRLYTVGQPLLSLRRQGGGLVTTLQGYRPGPEGQKAVGAFFKKTP